MRRRNFLGALFAAPVALLADPQINVPKIANEFAAEYNVWGQMRQETPQGAVSWPAKRQWDKKVKPAFHSLDVVVKNE